MIRTVALSTLALTLALAPAAFAGGAGCDKGAKAAKTAHSEHKAGHSEHAAKLAAKGWLGIETKKDEATGAHVVAAVAPGSPAAAAGFQKGDVLVALNGIALTAENKDALKAAKSKLGVGSEVSYTVKRAGAKQQIAATLAPVPQDVLAQWVAEEEARQPATAVAQSNN